MPELPEVETVRRGLAPVMEGRRILKVEQRRPDLRFPFPDSFADRLTGQTITALGRRAKYLLADLSSDEVLIMHLGMSGRFTITEAGETAMVYGAGAERVRQLQPAQICRTGRVDETIRFGHSVLPGNSVTPSVHAR